MKDLTVNLEDRHGRLADLGEATGNAGINIEGICGVAAGLRAVHVLVDDEAAARAALSDAGFDVGEARDVLVVDDENRPCSRGGVTRKLGEPGVNISLASMPFG